MSRTRSRIALALSLSLLGGCGKEGAPEAPASDAPEPDTAGPELKFELAGRLENGAINEASGLQAGYGGAFFVHNDEAIPREVQARIFQRSFSTKAQRGRGLGTYSMKLFGERYLGGEVSFTSTPEAGTEFAIVLPR